MEKQYLLDTNICIFFMRGKYNVFNRIQAIGRKNCCISEITVAELLYGAANCARLEDRERHTRQTLEFVSLLKVLPISDAIPVYADEKARLRRQGEPIDDFDLLIATTAVCHGLTLVTDNLRHMSRVAGVKLENWVER